VNLVEATIGWLADPAHWTGANGVPLRLAEHLELSVAAFAIAVGIALPLGLAVGHTGRGAGIAVNLANLGRAVPTLATIGIVAPLTQAIDPALGFTFYPTLIGLVVLALPPVLVNAYSGVAGVDRDLVEAARGMGMRERQILGGIEIPISLPVILAGLRLAAITIVATATLGAIFGYGGLGRYLVDGIAQNDDGQLFGGVVLAAGLTLLTEGAFALLQRRIESPGVRAARTSGRGPAGPAGSGVGAAA
jgi:osmoprotectant transport system permease protein